MSPLSDRRLPFSGFSSLSLQNKETPFQKSASPRQGGKLLLPWEGESEGCEGGVKVSVRMIWPLGPALGDVHTLPQCPHKGFLSLFQPINWLMGIINVHLGFFFLFLPWADRIDRKGKGKGMLERVGGVCSSHQGWYQVFGTSQRDTFNFTNHWATFGTYLFNFPFEVKWCHITESPLCALGASLWV